MKLTLILLLLITSLMAVVGAFLTINVSNFFTNTFYQQIDSVFGADQREFVSSLRGEAAQDDAYFTAGKLGIDYRSRNYFVLDGETGAYLNGSAAESSMPREPSPNLLTARNAVSRRDETAVGDVSDITADYMDAAIPIFGGEIRSSFRSSCRPCSWGC